MYTVEFIDGPWEGHTYDTESHREEIEPQGLNDYHGYYKLISEEHHNILLYKYIEEVSPQTH